MIPETRKRVSLELEVGVGVSAGRSDAGMPEVIADNGEVDAGLEKGASAAMTEHVRGNSFGESRVLYYGRPDMLGQDVVGAMPCKWRLPDAMESWLGRVGLLGIGREEWLDRVNGVGPERTESLFVPFAQQTGLMRRGELKVTAADGDGLADTGTGIVQEEQQRVVALPGGNAAIGLLQEQSHVVRFKIARRVRRASLGRQSQDTCILARPHRILTQGVLKKATQGDPATIARGDPILAVLLEMLEKRRNVVGLKIVDAQPVDSNLAAVGKELEKKFKCISVGRNGVDAGAPNLLQVFAEKRLHESKKRVRRLHDGEGAK